MSAEVGDDDFIAEASDAHRSGGEARPTSVLARLRRALFGAVIALSANSSLGRTVFALLHVVGLVQLLVLPLSPSLYWRVRGSEGNAVAGFHAFLTAVAVVPWVDPSGQLASYSPEPLFFGAAAYAALTAVLFVRVMLASEWGILPGRLELELLRVLLQVGITAGIVPLMANLVSPLYCRGEWVPGVPCFVGVHLMALILGLLLACTLLALLLCAALLLKSPALDLKTNPTLQAHGRSQAAQLLVRAVLAMFFVLAAGNSPW